jgi:DNA-binding helix-turn-helix protein
MKIQEMNEIVGEKIKNLRKSRNLSQEEVAEFIHVSQSTYARIESGASNSWAGYILPLCELFGIQPEELLKTDHIVINNNNTSCQYSGGYVVNQLSDKLIEQYEKRLAEKDSFISYLQKELEELKTQR